MICYFIIFSYSTDLANAQTDTVKRAGIDSLFLKRKGLLRQLGQNFLRDSTNRDKRILQRNDEPFQKYGGRVIRDIYIQTLEFGISVKDTSRSFKNKLVRLSNKLHYQTRDFVVHNNLFFSSGERLSPYILGDNERHLRDLPYIQDARIKVEPALNSSDSVDVIIFTKDVLSVGGSFDLTSNTSGDIRLKEDNFLGFGDQIQAQTLFDNERSRKMGYGFSYIKRNLGGSFIDVNLGLTSYNRSFSNNRREESLANLSLIRPFVNRYIKWSYGVNTELHNTERLYPIDTIYQSDHRYRYHLFDTWAVYNIDATKRNNYLENGDTYRKLIGLRLYENKFTAKPDRFLTEQNFRYNDVRAVLADISIFKQDFYKTQYIYGFGRNEDVPEGLNASITLGFTKVNDRERPYGAINFQRNFFTATKQYFSYTLRTGFYRHQGRIEDINVLASLDHFTRLTRYNNNWKQRTFISASIASQIKSVYNEALILESDFGLRNFNNNGQGAKSRLTLRAESVIFSPYSVLFFKFAPFVFVNASLLNLNSATKKDDQNLYSALGGGLRIRNESLIFGTIELKGVYFPRKNFSNDSYRFDIGTNIRFKYTRETIRRPEFVVVN